MRWVVSLFVLLLFFIPISLFVLSRNSSTQKEMIVVPTLSPHPSIRPSQGPDFSYIFITADKTATISAVNKSGQVDGYFLVQEGIRPPGLPATTGSPMSDTASYYVEQPVNGDYTATVATKEPGNIVFYLYDRNGNVSMKKFQQVTGVVRYIISFNKDGSSTVVKL